MFFTLFEGYKKLYEITPKKRFLLEPDKTNFTKLQKLQISQNEILCLIVIFTCVFSNPAKFEFIFLGSHKKLSLVLLQITNNYIYNPWKVQKRMQYGLKIIFWDKIFVHWKLKLLNFLMDFILICWIPFNGKALISALTLKPQYPNTNSPQYGCPYIAL